MSKELEEIENSFYKIKHFIEHVPVSSAEAYFYHIDVLEKGIKQLEKLKKFWEIVKYKPQQYTFIRKYNITRYLKEDLSYCANENDEELLTETEFNLLKEMLK